MNNDVFFLGSGFSKAIDSSYETLEDLSFKIIDNLECEKESIKSHLVKEVPNQYKKNIEILLTYLQTKLPYKTKVQVAADEALYMSITDNIARHFFSKAKGGNYLQNDSINTLIKYICDNNSTCLTLNYDLLLEELITGFLSKEDYLKEKIENSILYKIPMLSVLNRTDGAIYGDGTPPYNVPSVLKLHGSINWLYHGITKADTIYYKPSLLKEEDEYTNQLIEIGSVDLQYLIVPPVLDKTSSYGHIIMQTIWKEAYKKLQKAENIYIYGFSFPLTDLSVRYLFQSALSNNNNKPKIYIINTINAIDENNKKQYCKDRYEEIFAGYKLHFEYCCDNSLEKFVKDVITPKMRGKSNATK